MVSVLGDLIAFLILSPSEAGFAPSGVLFLSPECPLFRLPDATPLVAARPGWSLEAVAPFGGDPSLSAIGFLGAGTVAAWRVLGGAVAAASRGCFPCGSPPPPAPCSGGGVPWSRLPCGVRHHRQGVEHSLGLEQARPVL